jgi:hypothetical protein
MGGMEYSAPEHVDAILSMTIAAATGDDEAVEVFLRGQEPADLAVAATEVIWRMATALGQKLTPPRSPLQIIHVFAQALRDTGDVADELGGSDPS